MPGRLFQYFQGIAERDRRGFPADDCHGLGFLRLIAVDGLLCDGISAGEQALNSNVSVLVGFHGLVEAVALDGKGNPLNHAVLRCLFQSDRPCRRFHVDIRHHGIHVFHARNHVLQVRVAVGNHLRPAADRRRIVPCGGNPRLSVNRPC